MRECHAFLPLLEEMEKHINTFYQALERASRITSAARDPESQAQAQQKYKWQVRHEHVKFTISAYVFILFSVYFYFFTVIMDMSCQLHKQ